VIKIFLKILIGGLSVVFISIFLVRFGQEFLEQYRLQLQRESENNQIDRGSIEINGFSKVVKLESTFEEDSINSLVNGTKIPADYAITARAYLIKDLNTGEIKLAKSHSVSVPIASITKLVTAIVAIRYADLSKKVDVTNVISSDSTRPGRRYMQVGELLYPLLMTSSNESAELISRSYGRSKFIEKMNETATEIGAYGMYFADPSGISAKNIASANDLAILLSWIDRNYPEILEMSLLKEKRINDFSFVNNTHFLSWANYEGGKNGYIEASEKTSAGIFKLGFNGHRYAVVILGSKNRDFDTLELISKIK